MILLLSDAVLRTQTRRLGAAVSRSRMVAVTAAALFLIAPVAAWRVGRSVSGLLEGDTATLAVTRGLVLGLAVASAAAGAALGTAIPGRRALGFQIAAAPVPRAVAVAALALPAIGGATLLVGPTLVALAAALAWSSPGGAFAAVALALSFAAAAGSGAVAAEAVLHLVRQGGRSARAAGGVVVAGAAAATAIEGPAQALAQGGPVLLSSAVACAVAAIGSGVAWVGLAAIRPEPRVAARRRPLVVPDGHPVAAVSGAALALLSRAPDLRAALVAAASFGLVGLGVGLAAGAPASAALLLGGGACVVAAALVPLSARGRLDPGAWVWRAGARGIVAGGWAASSLGLVVLPLLPVGLIALVRPREAAAAAAPVVALAVAAWAAALAAGAVVPRRAHGAGDDALSLGAFTAATVGVGSVATLAGPMLGRAGVPDAIAALLVLVAASAGAVTLFGASWGRA